jgi:hypothetical protein
MTPKKAFERWETKISNTDVTPQAIWTIAKFLLNRDGPYYMDYTLHGPSGLKLYSSQKAKTIADSSRIQLTPRNLCDENHERRMKARVQALLEALDDIPIRG